MNSKTYLKTIDLQIAEYRNLLDIKASESKVHEFLASHSYFFNGILRMNGPSPLYSKIKLADGYITDFAWFDANSYGPEWRLTEIEAPSHSMFTKGGNPSAALIHAIQQVRDWHDWVHHNLDFAKKLMPYIDYPLGYVFIGRRHNLTPSDINRLKRIAFENRAFLFIHTLDWFANTAEGVAKIVASGNWNVPLKALSHRDLRKGLPENAQKWMDHYSKVVGKGQKKERLLERKSDYLSDEFAPSNGTKGTQISIQELTI